MHRGVRQQITIAQGGISGLHDVELNEFQSWPGAVGHTHHLVPFHVRKGARNIHCDEDNVQGLGESLSSDTGRSGSVFEYVNENQIAPSIYDFGTLQDSLRVEVPG